jgi:serine/threonine protein kinase
MGPCVDADTLRRWQSGLLDEARSAIVEGHVEGCARCREALEFPADDGREEDWVDALDESRGADESEVPSYLRRFSAALGRVEGGGGGHADGPGPPDTPPEQPPPDDPISASTQFRFLRSHAEGGLGEVLLYRDESTDRDVALKRIKTRGAADPTRRTRFLVEARITARLEHPGIVPVYCHGQHEDGRPFYVMRFVDGETLEEAIARFHRVGPDSPAPHERMFELRRLLGRFLDVCNAMAFAHDRNVLHRDLKPKNIMLGRYGETLIVDWGLAKVIGTSSSPEREAPQPPSADDSVETEPGLAMGTPAFMSPEQAAGRSDEVGPASDIYGLGATLYCLLTGRRPFAGQSREELLDKVGRGDFPPPHAVNRLIDRALGAICCKAMSLRPADRYATARLLAGDIEHWLADEPVSALPETLPRRLGRWARRHRTAVAAAVAVGLVAAVALGVQQAVSLKRETQFQRAKMVLLKEIFNDLDDLHEEREGRSQRENLLRDRLESVFKNFEGTATDPREVADMRDILGESLIFLRFPDEAINELSLAVRTREKLLGSEAPDTLTSRHNLACAYLARGDLAIAVGMLEELPATEDIRNHLAAAYSKTGHLLLGQSKWREAEENFKRCLEIWEESRPDAWITFEVRSKLGTSLINQGRYGEAEQLVVDGYKGMLARKKTIPPLSQHRLIDAGLEVVRLYERSGKPREVVAWKIKIGLGDLPADPFAR